MTDHRRGAPNRAGLLALGETISGANKGKNKNDRRSAKKDRRRPSRHSRRHVLIRRWIFVGLGVLLVLVVAGAGYLYYLTHSLRRVDVRGLQSSFSTGAERGTENILMVGSTSRCALAVQNPAYGLCSEGVNGVNSDVMMILHADPDRHRLALLSIPRDLFVPNARSAGANKVDAGLVEGISQVVSSIEEDLGIPIQHAVSLNFDQFANVVDALGGINMAFPQSVFDAESGLNVQAAPCVHLDGTQALQVVRARHLQYQGSSTTSYAPAWTQENESDLARIRRDHEFLRVLATAVAKRGLGNPISDLDLIDSLRDDMTFDQTWAVSDMVNLVLDFHSVNVNSVPQLTLPVAEVTDPDGDSGDLMYDGGDYGQVEFPAGAPDQTAIDQVLGIAPDVNTMNGQALPAPSSVSVSVENGTGAYNQATDTASALGALGFHTVGVGDVAPTGDVSETVVYYGVHTASAEGAAEAVVRSMSGSVIMAYDPSQVTDGAQVTVVTGSQFAVNSPPTSSASTGAAASSPTPASPSTAAPNSDIAAPNAANSGLAPWDPRACQAGAVPTAPVPNQT